ncbi:MULTISPECIES: DUF4396 domain-containing protein [Edwardsiella]|uniref:Integral membrane protein n=2 Tax=Edwardsiella anguillarum TaxID=1821960 RepID=A0A076LMH0_9GAMM|nr:MULTISPECIES: DUF4396 domain-containing protein [Edwardsiella]AIJ09710.1 integral membrane protein [Edwardsiella anguillarum ET080813]AKR77431.2 DUF4396 domain-containing protein [Edwardsiella sp. LADL05-105]KAB0592657.1 DUF4396 domain-containing protein [Edwardsiella anguillarum]UOU80479.1 DUF4396 domain-containing protein [Edwardsiella anguillarum]WHP85226.1 DUF4396 domain-containing protein [Edwardsiella anguillarum]
MSYPEWLHLLAWSWLISALICAVIIVWDIRRGHPQPMAIMTVAWPINALYFGVLGLGAYFWFGRGHPGDRCGMMAMDMPAAGHGETPMAMDMPAAGHGATPMAMDMPAAGHGAAPMAMDMPAAGHGATPMAMDMTAAGHGATPMAMDMPMAGHGDMPMAMKRGPAGWKSIFKTSTHCGTGCTLADILGEGIALVVPVTLLGSSLLGSWTLDFVLALCLGIFFQYWPARQMGQPRWVALKSAIKADVLSLICWQLGMYVWMAIALFLLFTPEMPRASALYWFMMQIAMIVGFCSAYPMNRWLVSKGIKHAM